MAAQVLSKEEADKEIRDLMKALEDLKTQPQPCLPCFEPPALDLKDLEDGSSCFAVSYTHLTLPTILLV